MQLKRLKPHLRTIALMFATALFSSLLSGTAVAQYYQENMVNGRNALQNAITWLNKASNDKGGHRANAINLTQQAIREVNLGIHYANGNR